MAVDKSYGSGKSRSAANSSARRRVAADQMTKGKKSPAEKIKAGRAKMAASPLGQLADTVLGFALPVGKLKGVASGLRAAQGGLSSNTLAMGQRIAAKNIGSTAAKNIAQARSLAKTASNSGPFPIGPVARMLPSMFRDSAKVAGGTARSGARRLFPQTERAAKEAYQAARTRSQIMKRGR